MQGQGRRNPPHSSLTRESGFRCILRRTGAAVVFPHKFAKVLAMKCSLSVLVTLAVCCPLLAFSQSIRPQLKVHEQVLYGLGEDLNGGYPQSSVAVDPQGNIYGTADLAGANGAGTVYDLTLQAGEWAITVLFTFDLNSGGNPLTGMLLDPAGNLYGTTSDGGPTGKGSIFTLTHSPSGWAFQDIHDFAGNPDGDFPSGNMIFGRGNVIYGTTSGGGTGAGCQFGCGTVFQLTRSQQGTWTETVLYSFQGGGDGSAPLGPMAIDKAGNLYGVTAVGGTGNCQNGCGTVFRLHPTNQGTWQKRTLLNFPGQQNGWWPVGGVAFDPAGNLYGVTSLGGDTSCNPPNGCGVVFKIDRSGQATVVHAFAHDGKDGMLPQAGVIAGPGGLIYGTTAEGGIDTNCEFGCGTVFAIDATGHETILYSFLGQFGGPDGAQPEAPLFWDHAGHLFGTTFEGGTRFAGTVFALSK